MDEAAVRVGCTLRDKWHLDALIDVGGMAAVYAATHRNGMQGAVKIMHRQASLNPEAVRRFLCEGHIANKVAHPNTVRILDDDIDDDGDVFIVMDLLKGGTLREWAHEAGGKLAPDQVLRLVDQVLDGLAALHDLGIVHRDIKPENLFLTTGGEVKILDFGIASIEDEMATSRHTTLNGMVMGSPDFMAPEQARGRWDLVDAQSDLWSVGATAFALLSGELVHTEETLPELLVAIFMSPARSLASVLPGAHPALVEVVDRALKLKRAERWPDARAMREAVGDAFLAMYGAPLASAAPLASPPFDARAPKHSPGALLHRVNRNAAEARPRHARRSRFAARSFAPLLAARASTPGVSPAVSPERVAAVPVSAAMAPTRAGWLASPRNSGSPHGSYRVWARGLLSIAALAGLLGVSAVPGHLGFGIPAWEGIAASGAAGADASPAPASRFTPLPASPRLPPTAIQPCAPSPLSAEAQPLARCLEETGTTRIATFSASQR
jgi:eukaryotic-like serine/threonine-protein kinase